MQNNFEDFTWDYNPSKDPYSKRTQTPIQKGAGKFAEVIFFGRLEDALLGIVEHSENPPVACYSSDAVISIFQNKHGLSLEDAEIALDQLINSNLGPSSPCFLDTGIVENDSGN